MSLKYHGKKISTIISVETYLEKIKDNDMHDRYEKYLKNDHALFNGMLKWKSTEEPFRWAGPYPLDYVHVTIDKYNTTKTEVDVFEEYKNYAKRSKFNRLDSVLERVGFNREYWNRPFVDLDGISHPEKICNYSEMTDEEMKIVESVETPSEKMFYERSVIKTLNGMDPKETYTVEHPFRVRLSGNDDCSYSYFYNADENEILDMNAMICLAVPCWFHIEQHFHFSN